MEQNLGQIYKQLFTAFIACYSDYCAKIDGIMLKEKIEILGVDAGDQDSYRLVFPYSDHDRNKLVQGRATNIFRRLMWAAAKEFAPSNSTPLKIDEGMFGKRFIEPLREKELWASFDPEAVWNALIEEYGGQKGEDRAFRQTAESLISQFRIKAGEPLEIKQGGPVINVQVWIDAFDKKYGRTRLSHGCEEGIQKILSGLAGVATWSGEIATVHALKQYQNRMFYNRRDSQIVSREKIPLGQITLTTYNTRFEFHFSKEFGGQLQMFLSTYALDKLQAAA